MNGLKGLLISGATWLGAILLAALGGWDAILYFLFTAILLDYAAGTIARAIKREPFRWERSYVGLLKKLAYFIAIATAVLVEKFLRVHGIETHELLRTLTITVLMATEVHSIYGHLRVCGLDLPASITDAIDQVRRKKE